MREGGRRPTQAELDMQAEAHWLVSFTPSCTAKLSLLPDLLQTGSGLENLQRTTKDPEQMQCFTFKQHCYVTEDLLSTT